VNWGLLATYAVGAAVGLAVYPWRHRLGLTRRGEAPDGPVPWCLMVAIAWPLLLAGGLWALYIWLRQKTG
jgi:hypothetical protein